MADRQGIGGEGESKLGRRAVLRATGAAVGTVAAAGRGSAHGGHGGEVRSVAVDGRGYDGVAAYELDVDGRLVADGSATVGRSVVEAAASAVVGGWDGGAGGATAAGVVGGWRERFEYTGTITDFAASAPVDLYVDGVERDTTTLDVPAATRTLTVDNRGYDHGVAYEFTVDGTVEPLASGDRVDGATASGRVNDWFDSYRIEGDVVEFTATGPADVFVGGQRVDPRTLGDGSDPDVVRVVGSDASYEFTVDGSVEPLASGDHVDGSTAGGRVAGWHDDYRVSGEITEFTHDGPVEVFVDGTGVDPADLDGAPTGGPRLRKLGQATLTGSQPGAGFAEARIRADGRYAVVGTKFGGSGTHLLDVSDPADPREVHYLPSGGDPNLDVKFGQRTGLYYRAIQGDGQFDVVDYGYREGSPSDPVVLATAGGWRAHNLVPHPTAPVVYTVNYDGDRSTAGFDVWDVSDPADPRKLRSVGRSGACHDVTVDPKNDLLHATYQGNDYDGYVVFDVSDPRRPTEVGAFGYAGRTSYPRTSVEAEGFGRSHHAEADPRRALVVVGDERSYGVPGGKHVFDVGWGDGSPSDPRPVGFVVSPNARRMQRDGNGDGKHDSTERWDWTGHDFDFVPRGDRTLLVSGDWHEGVVLYDVTDPTAPRAVDRYATADRADEVSPNPTLAKYGGPPWAWNAEYCPAADLVVACDQFTGVYTFGIDG